MPDRDDDPIWEKASPASEAAIANLRRASPLSLPEDYLAFLGETNGGEGDLGACPGWVILWRAEELLQNNRAYMVSSFLPSFFGIGSDGGGELLAFDMRSAQPFPVVVVPFIPMDVTEARTVARSFQEFQAQMGRRRTEPGAPVP